MAFTTAASAGVVKTISERKASLYPVEIGAWIIAAAVLFFVVLLSISNSLHAERSAWAALFRGISVGISTAAAATAVGGMLGFLFGIPRVLQKAPETPKAGEPQLSSKAEQLFATNTSLEDISDWLTKIIIGIGLVQFDTIIHYIYVCSLFAASYAMSQPVKFPAQNQSEVIDPALSVAFFFGIIITCLLGACMFVYLETRTRLTLIFRDVEVENVGGARREASEKSLEASFAPSSASFQSGPASVEEIPKPMPKDDELLKVPLSSLKTPVEIAGWAMAWARAGQRQIAEDTLRDALKLDPNSVVISLRLAEVRRFGSNSANFVDSCVELTRKPIERNASTVELFEDALLKALYLPPPSGFSNAIILADYLLADPAYKNSLTLIRRASAFGLKYASVQSSDHLAADAARKEALRSVADSVALVPDENDPHRLLLRQLLDPVTYGGNPQDNDLEVFKSDQEFRKLIIG
ncbi:hypothetical protein J2T09_004272 [Neorhizobium huautlense]|uniref:Tetratricopeptide repeat protein n=1 Tax=Neorhizobium huautlense TaxID=67774 RepID=A0ABT9PZF4_9HYPH|nr:hypothetical protein [Neorhizobium huautlense]MDP9839496.1 hypothetical protein [Neorhizobium huautlense]